MEMNDNIQVVLTSYGAEILNKQNEELRQSCPALNCKTDYKNGDIYITQLWNLFYHFGGCCHAGRDIVFTELKHEQKQPQEPQPFDEHIKRIACDFFYHWWNTPGTNTESGFDKWWGKNKEKYTTNERR